MERSAPGNEAQEAPIYTRRRRLKTLLLVVFGAIVLCLVACIGYFASRKVII